MDKKITLYLNDGPFLLSILSIAGSWLFAVLAGYNVGAKIPSGRLGPISVILGIVGLVSAWNAPSITNVICSTSQEQALKDIIIYTALDEVLQEIIYSI